MKTEYFILKQDGLYWVKDMPEKPTGVFRTEEILVSNSREVELEIISEICEDLVIDEIYPLECQVEIQSNCECPESLMIGCQKMDSVEKCKTTYLAFVKLKEETKNKKVLVVGSNKIHLSQIIKTALGQDAGTKEEEIHIDYLEKIIFEQVKKFDINYQAFITCEVANALKSNFIITKRQ